MQSVYDPEQLQQDMALLMDAAQVLPNPHDQATVKALIDCLTACVNHGRLVDERAKQVETLVADKQAHGDELKAIEQELKTMLSELERLDNHTAPELSQRLQVWAQEQMAKTPLSEVSAAHQDGQLRGTHVTGEAAPEEAGPGGMELWMD